MDFLSFLLPLYELPFFAVSLASLITSLRGISSFPQTDFSTCALDQILLDLSFRTVLKLLNSKESLSFLIFIYVLGRIWCFWASSFLKCSPASGLFVIPWPLGLSPAGEYSVLFRLLYWPLLLYLLLTWWRNTSVYPLPYCLSLHTPSWILPTSLTQSATYMHMVPKSIVPVWTSFPISKTVYPTLFWMPPLVFCTIAYNSVCAKLSSFFSPQSWTTLPIVVLALVHNTALRPVIPVGKLIVSHLGLCPFLFP